jgi:hypothetical protein
MTGNIRSGRKEFNRTPDRCLTAHLLLFRLLITHLQTSHIKYLLTVDLITINFHSCHS